MNSCFDIHGKIAKSWYIIAEINQNSSDVIKLKKSIQDGKKLLQSIQDDIAKGTENLKAKVAAADGLQLSNTDMCYARHYSNTMYNIMRGGVFVNNYQVDIKDYKNYLWQINKLLSKEKQIWLEKLPDTISYQELIKLADETNDSDLLRITYEYLPLTFSRRHGDPSRPWNIFSIETRNPDGSVKYNYEGNWRDIFQNWEALSYSFPGFIEGIISKFVNASTIDGYNPYRIMRQGLDWESPDPDDPWAYIGYWGDHQIIYLQKLLELSTNFHPGKLENLLIREIFTYANVPYRIKTYEKIINNPKDTVVFDHELNKQIAEEAKHLGADAKMLKLKESDEVYKVNLAEKIMLSLLSKLSNFIPEAGIWLNTQRPEWNDANNALVGNGTSMITLYYLRRFISFWKETLQNVRVKKFMISEEIVKLFEETDHFFKEKLNLLKKGFSDEERKNFADRLGSIHSKYRNEVYHYSFSGLKRPLEAEQFKRFLELSLQYIDQSVRANKRNDGLYHAYKLISIKKDKIAVRELYEMLEGQVAVLSAGLLSARESLNVLDALKSSKIYRPDQYSYMLYPDRELPRFTEKNIIPEGEINNSTLLLKLVKDKETSILNIDAEGKYHFNSTFRNADELVKTLDKLRTARYSLLVENERDKILDIYEKVFDHQSFTGRSGTFYGYEGLGSIYWHMVSKLLLACQESYFKGIREGADEVTLGKLKDHYYEIKAGIGLYKSPDLYGAFPMDAYSHTPANAGVKQPGLTGQVKEDVISRIAELGIRINEGSIVFDPSLLNKEELLTKESYFHYKDVNNESKSIKLNPRQIGFTFCQVPFIFSIASTNQVVVTYTEGYSESGNQHILCKNKSEKIFNRDGSIQQIEVTFKKL